VCSEASANIYQTNFVLLFFLSGIVLNIQYSIIHLTRREGRDGPAEVLLKGVVRQFQALFGAIRPQIPKQFVKKNHFYTVTMQFQAFFWTIRPQIPKQFVKKNHFYTVVRQFQAFFGAIRPQIPKQFVKKLLCNQAVPGILWDHSTTDT
jgi:small basic protein